MLKALITFPPDEALQAALEVVKPSRRASVSLSRGRVEVRAEDATALRAVLASLLRIMQAWERVKV